MFKFYKKGLCMNQTYRFENLEESFEKKDGLVKGLI